MISVFFFNILYLFNFKFIYFILWGLFVNREKKYRSVRFVNNIILSSHAVVIAHNLGLTVSKFSELRRSLYNSNANCIVLKNTLIRLSLLETIHSDLKEVIKGPVVLVCAKDIILLSKILVTFAKENSKFKIIAGSVGEGVVKLPEISYLADLPPLSNIRSKLVSIFNFPANKIVGIFSSPANRIAGVFLSYSKK